MADIIQISEVLYQSPQGMSAPYVCRAEDQKKYYVKGMNSGRRSQIAEILGWRLATEFGLPVPPACLLEVHDDLWEELPRSFRNIGKGVHFGSQEYPHARWFEKSDEFMVPKDLKRDLLVFDYWISNGDRIPDNSNLLVDDTLKQAIVIDHNEAFKGGVSNEKLIKEHIFTNEWHFLSNDLVVQAEYSSRLESALRVWDDACDNLPLEWAWSNEECDIPVSFDLTEARLILERFRSHDFWRAL